MQGACMKGQHKSLQDDMAVGKEWILSQNIGKAQWGAPQNPSGKLRLGAAAYNNVKQIPQHGAFSAYSMTAKGDLVTYLHQCLFNPPKRTLLKAIHNNQLVTWPGLIAHAVTKYLDDTPATDKGHMKQLRQGIHPTTKIHTDIAALTADMNPPQIKEDFNQILCYTGTLNTKDGTIYVDLTGKFPIRSLARHVSIFVLYD